VAEAGLAALVDLDHRIVPGLRLYPTPGHTPGHVSILLESAGSRAVISGDAVHHPAQLAHPQWGIFSDFDPEAARRSRMELFGMCADTGALFIGSHFAPPTALRIERAGNAFAPLGAVSVGFDEP
jgi:glyoxylase-like metal-dependent hydrolase (beta-lactamase superfamily II)